LIKGCFNTANKLVVCSNCNDRLQNVSGI